MCGVHLKDKKRDKALMLMLGLNETKDFLAVQAVCICMVRC